MNKLFRCPKCKTAKKDAKFCSECGEKLESFSDASGIWKPEAMWRVTTQGDEEGRTTKQLGVHEGHIVDIAHKLSAESFYDLCFEPVLAVKKAEIREPRSSVHVTLGYDSGTTTMESSARQAYFRAMIKDRDDVKITESNYYGAVVFNFKKKEPVRGGPNDR